MISTTLRLKAQAYMTRQYGKQCYVKDDGCIYMMNKDRFGKETEQGIGYIGDGNEIVDVYSFDRDTILCILEG